MFGQGSRFAVKGLVFGPKPQLFRSTVAEGGITRRRLAAPPAAAFGGSPLDLEWLKPGGAVRPARVRRQRILVHQGARGRSAVALQGGGGFFASAGQSAPQKQKSPCLGRGLKCLW